ncbi:protein-L-isoaspartate O-methyltransferase [Halobacteriales archaeon QS_3_64_16]|nr:MAG: protein-L-isoaspartate O-methyltransferase [Halobacteriales archaeon QS_3_64_16]
MTPNADPNHGETDGKQAVGSGDANDRDEETDDRRAERENLLVRLLDQGRIEREVTADALRAVPRHAFVPLAHREAAYEDRPLPIGEDQTISAPHMVDRMTDLLAPASDDRILEIGTGCGYHAALTAELASEVKSVGYHANLAEEARDRLADLGYENVAVQAGDGHGGLPEGATYDAAYLTCGASAIPDSVIEQVRPGGRILAPIETDSVLGRGGRPLVRVTKRPDGALDREDHGSVRFVRTRGSS